MATLGGHVRGISARAWIGTSDDGYISSRDRRRIAVCRIAGNRRDQAGGGHPAARAQSIRLGLRLGRVPHEQRMATIALYGREVIPRVRELLAAAPAKGDASAE